MAKTLTIPAVARVGRGEIWQYSFPKPDRRRPVLVLTRRALIGRLHTVTIAPITSTIRSDVAYTPPASGGKMFSSWPSCSTDVDSRCSSPETSMRA